MILCVLSGAFLFWTIRNGEKVRERIRLDTTKLIKRNYGTGNTNATEMLVDRIQRYFTCCGIMGPEDWITSNYNNQTNEENFNSMNNLKYPSAGQRMYRIPKSCCQDNEDRYNQCIGRVEYLNANDIQNLKEIVGLNNDGCMNKFEDFIRHKQLFVIMAGAILVGVQLLALIFSFCLFCAISRQDDK